MKKINLRRPVVAGQFYPLGPGDLKKQIENFIDQDVNKLDVIACMLPHAGYIYSGRVAALTVSRIKLKDKIILLGPNHTGEGQPFSIMTEGVWQTPFGEVEIDSDLAGAILSHSQYLQADTAAHTYEHSLEVELPILQYFKPTFQIVPICILSNQLSVLKEIGEAVAKGIKEKKSENACLLVASSDMTHYEPEAVAKKKDEQAIQTILELDEDKLRQKVQGLDISMCGYAPVSVMLVSAKLLGAKKGELVRYQTSGDITDDRSSVVGYAGVIIY